MERENLLDLFVELENMRFWGSVKIYFRDGHPMQIETIQTIKKIDAQTGMFVNRIEDTDITDRF